MKPVTTHAPEARAVSSPPMTERQPATLGDWVRLLRPRQWVKNCFVLAPLLFSGRAGEPEPTLLAAGAFVSFCLLASGGYLVNDVVDRDSDRVHPDKRHRPIAAGRLSPRAALGVAGALFAAAFAIAVALGPSFTGVALAYVTLNGLYSLRLKHVVILEVFVIATFFILRLVAGSVVISVTPSIWLLLCGGLLALYLGFAKRRHELGLLGDGAVHHRSVLAHYSAAFLDQMSAILLSVTVVAYIMYSLTSETAAAVGSERLAYSTAFVLYGVFRYLYLVHQRGRGSPTETLLTDGSLLFTVFLWLLYCGWVIYRPL